MQHLNIGIYIVDGVAKHWGGGFSYQEALIEEIEKINGQAGVRFFVVKWKGRDSFNSALPTVELDRERNSGVVLRLRRGLAKRRARHKAFDENKVIEALKRSQIHLLFYLQPHQRLTYNYPFVINNWDLAHITAAGFPDVTQDFEVRDGWVRDYFHRALHIIAESRTGFEEVVKYALVPERKVSIVPMFPGRVARLGLRQEHVERLLASADLSNLEYYFYPAQFWALKNHYNLLLAYKKLVTTRPNVPYLVLTGSPKSNFPYIEDVINDLGLNGHVRSLGFVSDELLFALYKKAVAMVFPSLLGPTNMPILEALEIGCPILCSDLKGHQEMLPNYSGFFNPLDVTAIATQLANSCDARFRARLLDEMHQIRTNTEFSIERSVKCLVEIFSSLRSIRFCWE